MIHMWIKIFLESKKVFDLKKELVSCVDIVSLHVPHEKETENMFNEGVFSSFKDGSYFINTSRGELVDHYELLKQLENKKIKGAAMDVFENEFTEGFESRLISHPLWHYAQNNKNLIITPHIGGSTKDAWAETEERVLKNNPTFGRKKY